MYIYIHIICILCIRSTYMKSLSNMFSTTLLLFLGREDLFAPPRRVAAKVALVRFLFLFKATQNQVMFDDH